MKIIDTHIKEYLKHQSVNINKMSVYKRLYKKKLCELIDGSQRADSTLQAGKEALKNGQYLHPKLKENGEWFYGMEDLEFLILKWGMKIADMLAFYLPERIGIVFGIIWKTYRKNNSKKEGINFLLHLYVRRYLSQTLNVLLANENRLIMDHKKIRSMRYFFNALKDTLLVTRTDDHSNQPRYVTTLRDFFENAFENMARNLEKIKLEKVNDKTLIKPQRFALTISLKNLQNC
jgi:hypothetical protein